MPPQSQPNPPTYQPPTIIQPIQQNPQPNNNPITPSQQNLPGQKPKKYNKEGILNVVFTVMLFIMAPLFALIMILFVFQSYVVDGSSMEPTLQNGNRLFILKLPKTLDNLRGKDFIPTRGEVIVFKKPSDPDLQLIKRVIGLPGDRVVVKDYHITVYNDAHPNGYNPDTGTDYGPNLEPTTGSVDITVGEKELFVAGDNRAPGGSLDSRSGLGLVPIENIIGRLWTRYFPISEFKLFSVLEFYQQSLLIHLLSYR